MRNRLLELPVGNQQVAKVVVSFQIIREHPQGLEILLFGGFPVALSGECQSKIVVTVFIFRVQLHRLLVLSDRLINLSLSQQLSSAIQEVRCSVNVFGYPIVGGCRIL